MRRSRAIRLTLLPVIAASSLAMAQERGCLDGTNDEGCLRADPQVSSPSGTTVYPYVSGGFGAYFWRTGG